MFGPTLLMIAAQAAAIEAPSTRPAAQSPSVEEVVVTARPGSPRALPDAVAYLRRFCFDPLRLTGRFAPPEDDPDWMELPDELRRSFGTTDPSVPAYGLSDAERGHTLLAKFERAPGRKGWDVIEERCTIVMVGGRDHARLRADMDALFGASGTRRHLGERDGAPRLAGWDQLMWSAMPDRRAKRWTALKRDGRGNESAALFVFDPEFYDRYDYILGDLTTRIDGARPLSILSFVRIRRAAAHEKGRPLAAPPSSASVQPVGGQKSR